MDYRALLTEVGKNALAVGAVEMVNVVDKVPLQRTEMTSRLKQGATYTLARDLVDFLTVGQSDVLNMNYRNLIDSTAWYGLVGYGVDKSGVGRMAEEAVRGVSPFDTNVNDMLIDGSIMTLSSTLRDMAEVNPLIMTTPLRYAIRPTSILNM